MNISRFTGRKISGLLVAASLMAGLLAPAVGLNTQIAAYTISEENESITYGFEEADFADGIAQDENSLLIDGTSDNPMFTAAEIAAVGGKWAASSPVANVVNLSNGKDRCENNNYSSDSLYPALAVGHNNVLRLGVNGGEPITAGGVMLNDGETVLELSAGKYIIGFDYYATEAVRQNGTSLEIMNNASELVKADKSDYIGEKRNTLQNVFNGDNAVTGSWQTVAFTLEIGEESRNIGFYAENLKKDNNKAAEIFLDNITVSAVSTVSFESDCDIMPISGEPGAKAELPDESDVIVTGRKFAGWYADAEYELPVNTESFTFPTDSLSVNLYAKMVADPLTVPLAEFNFDSGDYAGMVTNASVGGTRVSGSMYAIADTASIGGSGKALAIKPVRNLYDGNGRSLAFNNGSSWFTLEPGSYKISYRYMVSDRDTADFTNYNRYKDKAPFLGFVTDIPKTANSWSQQLQGTVVGGQLFNLSDTSGDDSWHDGSINISVSASEALSFGIRAEYLYFDIYLDDITIVKQSVKNVTVEFETNGGSEIAPLIGAAGSAITVENPVKDGFSFAGWYTDPGLTVPAEMTFPSDDAVYYAKWADALTLITFDGDFKTGTITAGLVGGGMFQIAGAPDNADNKTLLIGGDRALYNGEIRTVRFNNGTDFMTVSAGDRIAVTYSYYITDRQGDADSKKGDFAGYDRYSKGDPEIYLMYNITGSTAANIKGEYATAAGQDKVLMADVKNDAPNVWHTKTLTVDIAESGVIGLSASQVWADVYFDNMSLSVVPAEKITVSFDSQGGTPCDPVSAAPGYSFTLPTPTREGYTFMGWFTGPNGTGTRASSTAPQTDITYYASWSSGDSTVFLDFENGLKPGSAVAVGSGFFKTGSGDADHGKVMIYEPTNNLARPRMLDDRAKVLPNTDYKITFEYLVKSLPESGAFEFDFATALGTGTAVGTTAYEVYTRIAQRNLLDEVTPENTDIVGKWRTAEIIVRTPSDVGTGYLAVFGVNGSDAVIWFDNMEITRIDSSSAAMLYIDYGYNGMTEIRYGTAGEAINLGTPVREGFVFEGWKDENGNPFSYTHYPAHGVIYAIADWTNITPHTVTFDDMPESLTKNENGKFVTAACFSIVDGKGQNGTKAMKYSNGSSQIKFFALNDGKSNFSVKKGTTYEIKIHYFVESGSSAPNVSFATADPNNYFNNRTVQSAVINLDMTKGSWQELTMFITPDRTGALFMGLRGGAGSVFYFDNIEFRAMSKSDVVLTYSIDEIGFSKYVVGHAGDPISAADIPSVNPKNYSFAGWFIDEEYTTPFKGNVFPAESMTVYGKLTVSDTFVIDFTDYPYEGDTTNIRISASVMSISHGGPSSDGDGSALLFDNTLDTATTDAKRLILGAGAQGMPLQAGMGYLISYDYYIVPDGAGSGSLSVKFAYTSNGSMWVDYKAAPQASVADLSMRDAGKWHTGYAVLETDSSIKNSVLAAAVTVPLNTKVYIDNIRVVTIEDGYAAVCYSAKTGDVPEPSVVKVGTSVKLPSLNAGSDYLHLGWRDAEGLIEGNTYTVLNNTILTAELTIKRFTEDFEKTSYIYEFGKWGCEPDMEIYDSASDGNSSENVHSGRYSYHRIGEDPSFRAYSIQFNDYMSKYTLSSGRKYTVSMWVKIENPVHKLGAIELISSTKATVPWSYEGDRNAIVDIASVADGAWHEISFTFTAVTSYISIITPGNLSIYIDDINVEYTPDNQLSSSVEYEEYIPRFLNEDGTYSTGDDNSLAAYSVVNGDGRFENWNADRFLGSSLFVTVIICSAAVVLSVCASVAIIALNKRKVANK